MYIALYRKYRPKLFRDVLSQNHITFTLKNEVCLEKIAHAYIFAGPKGSGKTSCAKIFSKAINCIQPREGEPCGSCSICIGLENNSILDVTELDGASNNSVNDIRNLKDESAFVPTICKYRVYIIDEAHMLSTNAFNALLKVMEEPRSYVVFILATTEIYKIPQTVVSRCQSFYFNRINIADICNNLKYICKNEGVNITDKAATQLAAMSYGSMRDALSMLNKCIICYDDIDVDVLEKTLNNVNKDSVVAIYNAIKSKDRLKAIKIINRQYYKGKEIEHILLELIEFYREVLYCGMFKNEAKEVLRYCKYIDIVLYEKNILLEEMVCIIDQLLDCYKNIKDHINKKLFFEMCIIRLCSVRKVLNNKYVLDRACNKSSDEDFTYEENLHKRDSDEDFTYEENLHKIDSDKLEENDNTKSSSRNFLGIAKDNEKVLDRACSKSSDEDFVDEKNLHERDSDKFKKNDNIKSSLRNFLDIAKDNGIDIFEE